jgi:hypothetical protein
LAAEAQAGQRTRHKSVIMVYLVGGPPHQDMWDLKPDAPSEVAGPMRPTKTNVPGIEICDLFPQLAHAPWAPSPGPYTLIMIVRAVSSV